MGRNNDYTTGNLVDYVYFSKYYKLITIRLSKQIELEKPVLKLQINFTGRLEINEGAKKQCFSSLKIQKKQLLNFHKMLQQLFDFDYV